MSIGAVLREQRTTLGLTVAHAAGRGGVTRSYLSMVETGQRAPNPEALVRFTRALGIPTEAWLPAFLEDEWRCQRLVSLGRALFEASDYPAALRALARALHASRSDYNGRYNSEIYMLLGRVRYAEGRYRQALRWLRRVSRAVSHSQDVRLKAATDFNLAQCMAKAGHEIEALEKYDAAVDGFRTLRLWALVGKVWLAKGNLLLEQSMYMEAHEAYRNSARFLRGQPFQDDALLGVAITAIFVKSPSASVPLFRKIIDGEHTSVIVRAKARDNLATALREVGLYEEAVSEARSALETRDQLPPRLVAALLAEEALSYALMGDLGSTLKTVEEYKLVLGEKDGQDVAAMRILARALRVAPPQERVDGVVGDDHEHHVREALRILQSTRNAETAQRRKGGTSAEPA